MMPPLCQCGGSYVDNPTHMMCCPAYKKKAINRRHNMIVQTINRHVRHYCGAQTDVEPKPFDNSGKQLDLSVFRYGGTHDMLDVTCGHAWAPTHIPQAKRKPLATATEAEKAKTEKYGMRVEKINANFVPFAVETSGAIGDSAYAFICKMGADAEAMSVKPCNAFVRDLVRDLAFAIQRGNAYVMSEGLVNARVDMARRH
eukprot:TRINITY_DN3671_c0_g3_i4.p2 TRINITY_DN3671_c0_g3~~TRINITY_DN3671_c0_g3_i4.p2  ORF type:complete len:200 (-),score=13.46 TRINITY_DN3671_c0_g3_i4:267-866(-)